MLDVNSVDIIPLDLDSTRRDRMRWPNQFTFEVPLNNTGQKINGMEAFDPVTLQLPVNLGTVSVFNEPNELKWTGLDPPTLSGTITNVSRTSITINISSSPIQMYNFYRGMLGTFSTGGTSTVLTYTYLGNNMANLSFDAPIPNLTVVGATFTATYNSSSTSNCIHPIVFVPRTMDNLNLNNYLLLNETLGENRVIVSYDSPTSQATLNKNISSWTNNHNYSIRQLIPFVTTVISSTPSTITVTAPAINTGDFVRNQNTGELRKVVAITGSTLTLDEVMVVPWIAGSNVELLAFAYDNFSFVTYGNLQREAATTQYFIKLVSLMVPLQPLLNGACIETIPYLYVKIEDTGNPITNTFMSNNQGAREATFKVTMKRHHNNSAFAKFTGDNDLKPMKFRPSAANLRFSIMDPAGNVLKLLQQDTVTPNPANRLLQTSVLIHLLRS